MTKAHILAIALAGGLFLASPAPANDGGQDPRNASPTVFQDPVYTRAMVEVKAGRYATAIPLLANVVAHDPKNADAFNNLGYSHRKLGQHDKAMTAYAEALRLDPKHLGALEYQGELFLEMGDLPHAEGNLARLAQLCGTCENYEDLAEAITAYKAKPKA